jgi:hypothetical protein
MKVQPTLHQQLEAFNRNEWLNNTNDCFYFYDWFCKKTSLERKAKSLMVKVKKFIKKMNIDIDKTYVFFKNNCPGHGSLYDDFRICDIESGDVIYTVAPSLGYTKRKGEAEIWGRENGFNEPIKTAPSWKELVNSIV